MATRQEIQVALDLVRFTNIMNDLFDSLKDEKLSEFSIDDQKKFIQRKMFNIKNYQNVIQAYVGDINNSSMVDNGLAVLGVSKASLLADVISFGSVADQVDTLAKNATTAKDVADTIQCIKDNVADLKLLRKVA